MTVDDHLWLWVNRDGADDPGDAAVLSRLEAAGVPTPASVEATGTRATPVQGWDDPALARVLAQGRGSTEIRGEGIRVDRDLGDRLIWTVRLRLFEGTPPATAIRDLFLGICTDLEATYGRGHLERHDRTLYDEHYGSRERTFYANGLYWLNWFGPGEAERQGGVAALAEVAGARATVVGAGVLLEVGDDYLDATTEAGRDRLLATTAALPALPGESGDALPEGEPVPDTVNGIRGIRYASDRSFWVNINLAPGRSLAASRVADLAALSGSGDPPISHVNVLFSERESAQGATAALEPLGVRAWYVDDETGRPLPT